MTDRKSRLSIKFTNNETLDQEVTCNSNDSEKEILLAKDYWSIFLKWYESIESFEDVPYVIDNDDTGDSIMFYRNTIVNVRFKFITIEKRPVAMD